LNPGDLSAVISHIQLLPEPGHYSLYRYLGPNIAAGAATV